MNEPPTREPQDVHPETHRATRSIAVVGAGTMGSGIAELALTRGFHVALYDVSGQQLARAQGALHANLTRLHERGKLREHPDALLARLTSTSDLGALGGADVIIEAAPERLDLKRDLFRQLDEVNPAAVLATNTSTLLVSAIAAGVENPARVVGMHFFNPAQVLPLVEVIRGEDTGDDAVRVVTELARTLGKTPVLCQDTPGFIVNRVARPFYGEGLRLAAEQVGTYADIDRVMRGAGFRMGPFELMDLIGLDVNYASTNSVYDAYFHDPKYRPHPTQARLVAAGRLGRKTGRGFYPYPQEKPETSAATTPARPDAKLHFTGHGPVRDAIEAALGAYEHASAETADWIIDCTDSLDEKARLRDLRTPASFLTLTYPGSATRVASLLPRPERAVGFSVTLPLAEGSVWEVTPALQSASGLAQEALVLLQGAGVATQLTGETPGGIAARTIAMLANEAVSALAEGVADAATIDTAMRLGTNYPRGPLEWAALIGLRRVLTILEGLHAETGDDRYRPHPLLRRAVLAERTTL